MNTDESLLTDTRVSLERGYPHAYHRLVTNEDEAAQIRWEYLREASPNSAQTLADVSLDDGFLIVAGLILPEDKKLRSVETRFNDGMAADYAVVDRSSEAHRLRVASVVEYWEYERRDTPPAELSVTFRYTE